MTKTNITEPIGPNGRVTSDTIVFLMFCVPGIDSMNRHLEFTAQASALCADDGKAFWDAAAEVLPSCDYIQHEALQRLFRRFAASAPPVDLPERVKIYRGQSGDAPMGLFWTLSRDVAEGFARGFRGLNSNPTVFEIEVSRDQIAMYLPDREEETVVLKAIPA